MAEERAIYNQIIGQIKNGEAILFLGSGSTYNCRRPDGRRGLTGEGLANEILQALNPDPAQPPGFKASLMEASEYFVSVSAAGRKGLDKFIQERLSDLQPTLGHYIAASFPWRAVITTNYNRVAEDAWGEAHAAGYAAREALPIRTDADILQHAGDVERMRLYKPHGCVTVPMQHQNRMVLTSVDYFVSEKIREEIYKAIRSLIWGGCTTLFVGYSLNDFTFRNIFYRLYSEMGQWAARSYSVAPVTSPIQFEWMSQSMDKNFNTTLINDGFDTFMLRLARHRGAMHPSLEDKARVLWRRMAQDNAAWVGTLAPPKPKASARRKAGKRPPSKALARAKP